MGVHLPPGGGWNAGSRSTYRTPAETTTTIREVSVFVSVITIVVVGWLVLNLLGVFLGVGFVWPALLCVGIVVSTSQLFYVLPDRKVAIVLLPLAVLIVGAIWPGVPSMVALVLVVASSVHVLYLFTSEMVRSRALAVCIAALPFVLGTFYVPSAIERAGLVTNFGAQVPSPMAERLVRIAGALQEGQSAAAVLTFNVRSNRLYADIAHDGQLSSIAMAIDVRTGFPWLERNVTRQMELALGDEWRGEGESSKATDALREVRERLDAFDTLLVADGALMNYPYRMFFSNARIIRSVSADDGEIIAGLERWTHSPPLRAANVTVINALPRSANELARIGFDPGDWPQWQEFHQRFAADVPLPVPLQTAATREAVLRALQSQDAVLLVVAHSDGVALYLPNGEVVTVMDLETVKDAIREQAPRVFLFSCETARMTAVPSFAKRLLDAGASAVIAPVTRITADSAERVFGEMLRALDSEIPLSIRDAFDHALQQTGERTMEVWVAEGKRADDAPRVC